MTTLMQHFVTAPSKEREREIASLGPWFHNLHLPDGSQTAPFHQLGDFPSNKWAKLGAWVPKDLSGWRALDIGCNAGYYTFELAKRGAEVLGIDSDPMFVRQARWAAREFDLADRVELREMQVYDLAGLTERFDLVLFMGVFYHLRHPLLALDIVAERVSRLLIFQTMTMPGNDIANTRGPIGIMERDALLADGWPKMAFIEHELAGDLTNWWAPNHAAVEAMLRSSGLRVIGYPGHEIYACEPNPGEDIEVRKLRRREMEVVVSRTRH